MTSPGNSFAGGMGCAHVGMGLVAFAFGVAGLFGAGVELELFALNDRAGRWIWVAGSVAASGIGILLLRRRPRA